VVRRIGESGLSSAVMAGMAAANGAVLAVIDADLQHDESVLPKMVSVICEDGADVVVGTRAAEGGSYGDWGAARRFVSWVATLIARIFLRVPVSDPMSGFFAISRRTYEQYGPTINPQGFKILLEFVGRRHPGLRVREVGFTFRNRLHGETKLSPSVIRSYILAVVELRLGRQVKGQFVLYCLVGLSGVAVNLVVFEIFEHLGLGAIDLGFKNPVRWSLLAGIQASIISNFLLNNYFTFWERRFHRRQLPWGFVLFEVVSLLGVFVHVAVFQFLELNRWGAGVLGETTVRLVHDAIGFTIALVTNYFLNVNYVWARRRAGG
jgi:dolichol-phosphate mannosyltransferase